MVAWPDHLLTLAEWEAMPEGRLYRYELVEGVLLVRPRAVTPHQRAMAKLATVLDQQLPPELVAVQDVEVLVDSGFPPTVRVPDVVVVPTALLEQNLARFDATDVRLAVEIISPGSSRTDRVMKLAEYAEAGIPHYWIIDLDPPTSLTGYLLVAGQYELDIETHDTARTTSPASLSIELAPLTRR
jgi:Uma2 family endonuclease